MRWPPETFLCWRFEALAARGYRITVLCPPRMRRGDTRLNGVSVRTLPEPGGSRSRILISVALGGVALLFTRPGVTRRLLRAVRTATDQSGRSGAWRALEQLRLFLPLARLRPDIAHFEWNPEAAGFLPMAEVWDCPTVSSCHGSGVNVLPHEPGEERFRADLARSFRDATAVHCVSDAIGKEARRYGLDPAKVHTIKSAVDPERFRPPAVPRADPDALHVVAVGFLRWLKGYEYALEAIRGLVDRGVPVRFDILGEDPFAPPPDSEEVRRLLFTIADLGLSDVVKLRGLVSSDEVLERLQSSDVLLLASLTEGLPTVLLEAMACELPVVASDCGGVREAVRDGVDGFVVAPRDPGELAGALRTLWERPELRRSMGREGRRRVISHFALDDQADRFADMYETLVSAPPLHLLEVGVRWPPETFVRAKLERLAAAGVRVTVASALPPGAPRPSLPGLELLPLNHWDVPVRRQRLGVLAGAAALAIRSPRRALALLAAVRRRPRQRGLRRLGDAVAQLWRLLPLAAERPDVVQFEWETAAVHFQPLVDVWNCPVVMACRGGDITLLDHLPDEPWTDRVPAALSQAAAVHCVSEATARQAERHGLDPARARVIRTAVDPTFFSPNGGPPRDAAELRVASVGSLRWPKDHEAALQALARLDPESVPARLEIVGGDPGEETGHESQRERLLYTAQDLGVGDRVTIHGELEARDVRDRLRATHVLLHASLVEGIPNVVVEAMACAVPVVVSDCGGVREAVTDGVEGFVVAPRDTHAMASALEHLWRDPELRRRMGAAGRRRAEADFAPQRQVEDFLELYRTVAA